VGWSRTSWKVLEPKPTPSTKPANSARPCNGSTDGDGETKQRELVSALTGFRAVAPHVPLSIKLRQPGQRAHPIGKILISGYLGMSFFFVYTGLEFSLIG
jgi:hypothetical protein